MNLSLRPAEREEYEKVKSFYYELIDEMQDAEYHPKWQKGIYPEDSYIKSSVEKGQMYLTEADGKIIGAMILNHSVTDGYETANWGVDASENEVTVIHALGVLPMYSNQGVGRFMTLEALKIAKADSQKAVRLDVLEGNLPAEKLYKSVGFSFVQKVKLFYEDTGLCNFDLYEFIL